MSRLKAEAELPRVAFDLPQAPSQAMIAVDLGAESCRVSLLRWRDDLPHIELVHRFANGPVRREGSLHWDLQCILDGVDEGLRRCAAMATEGIASIAVDGWAVDYVRLDESGEPIADPFCYRDPRSAAAETSLHNALPPERLRELTGIQLQPLNTVYQQHADVLANAHARWLNLPEFLLYRWGGRPVAESTNATHTGMVGLNGEWCEEIFTAAGLRIEDAPQLVEAGTDVGAYNGPIAELHGVRLIAPCCHDTASAVAGIPASGHDWAYISSGTWSLVGTVLDAPCNSAEAKAENFTNLGAAGGKFLFHKGMSGMWLLQQCIVEWGATDIASLIEEAALLPATPAGELLDVDDASLAQPGDMPSRINAQREAHGLKPVTNKTETARLIFDSLAARYAQVLRSIASMTGKDIQRIYIVGGGSQNTLLNRLTADATGMEVVRGAVESSTLGNFAVQLAAQDGDISAVNVARWAHRLHI